jgi:hypothetical protein
MHGEPNVPVLMLKCRTYGGMDVKFQIFLTLKTDVNRGSASNFSAFTSEEKHPLVPIS